MDLICRCVKEWKYVLKKLNVNGLILISENSTYLARKRRKILQYHHKYILQVTIAILLPGLRFANVCSDLSVTLDFSFLPFLQNNSQNGQNNIRAVNVIVPSLTAPTTSRNTHTNIFTTFHLTTDWKRFSVAYRATWGPVRLNGNC